jgi:fused signal recognition particle receptor
MFDSLRKKLSSFIGQLAPKEQAPAQVAQPVQVTVEQEQAPQLQAEHAVEPVAAKLELTQPIDAAGPVQDSPKIEHEHREHKPVQVQHAKLQEKQVIVVPEPEAPQVVAHPKSALPEPVVAVATAQQPERAQRDLSPKLGLLARVKSLVAPDITLTEGEVAPVISSLHMALLESDVSPATADFLASDLSKRLVGAKVRKSSMQEYARESVRLSLTALFTAPTFDLFSHVAALKAKGQAPIAILMVGPNGAGKTTTVAKLAKQFGDHGFTSIISASDTFRKAAIEQAVFHGEKLNVRVVKQDYGADPTAVAFDAVSAAKSTNVDVVLVDTAGRQETNANLLREVEKMNRVIKPQLKIFVGEAIAGHALVEQAKKFDEAIKLDGLILTKLDCDAKGGISFSLGHELKVPILFVGTGQGYDDLKQFEPDWITDNVLAA